MANEYVVRVVTDAGVNGSLRLTTGRVNVEEAVQVVKDLLESRQWFELRSNDTVMIDCLVKEERDG